MRLTKLKRHTSSESAIVEKVQEGGIGPRKLNRQYTRRSRDWRALGMHPILELVHSSSSRRDSEKIR